MKTTTTLTLSHQQIERLLDGLEGTAEPLALRQTDEGMEPLADWQDHEALMSRLRTALTRVQPLTNRATCTT